MSGIADIKALEVAGQRGGSVRAAVGMDLESQPVEYGVVLQVWTQRKGVVGAMLKRDEARELYAWLGDFISQDEAALRDDAREGGG